MNFDSKSVDTGIREGNPELLSQCFWSTVQGIMEEMAYNPKMKAPDPAWIVAVIKK